MAIRPVSGGGKIAGLNISVDTSEVEAMARGISSAAITRAVRRATKKTAQWLRGRIVRHLAQYLGAAQKNIANRVKVSARSSTDGSAYLWLGTSDVLPLNLGLAGGEAGTGYEVGDWFFQGGFRARMPSGHEGVFKRRGTKRLKIDEQGIAVNDQAESYLDKLLPQAERELHKKLEQEINYEMHKAGL